LGYRRDCGDDLACGTQGSAFKGPAHRKGKFLRVATLSPKLSQVFDVAFKLLSEMVWMGTLDVWERFRREREVVTCLLPCLRPSIGHSGIGCKSRKKIARNPIRIRKLTIPRPDATASRPSYTEQVSACSHRRSGSYDRLHRYRLRQSTMGTIMGYLRTCRQRYRM
jgi:hypothetical protein